MKPEEGLPSPWVVCSCQLAPRWDEPSGSENTGKYAPQRCPIGLKGSDGPFILAHSVHPIRFREAEMCRPRLSVSSVAISTGTRVTLVRVEEFPGDFPRRPFSP